MKLRNKKTGRIKELVCLQIIEKRKGEDDVFNAYKSLNQLNEEWEDVGDTNDTNTPLIKDEKIRKAIRAWAEANKFSSKMFFTYYANLYQLSCWQASIEFNSPIDGLKDGKEYYFTELCGEEE